MHELLNDIGVLRVPVLDLVELRLAGVDFGASARSIPRDKIREVTFSPIVVRSSGSGLKSDHFDAAGRRLSAAQVIDSVMDASGILHFENQVSFKIVSGLVAGFALYGERLRHFDYLESYEDFQAAFGPADRVITEEAYGDLMGYKHYYFRSRKLVSWTAFQDRIRLINLGEFDGNDG